MYKYIAQYYAILSILQYCDYIIAGLKYDGRQYRTVCFMASGLVECCKLRQRITFVLRSVIRCKESQPAAKLSQEDLDAIAEIEDSMIERANVFSEMEAFLPKKNGSESPRTFNTKSPMVENS